MAYQSVEDFFVNIDDKDELYKRVIHYYITDQGISPSAFKDSRKKFPRLFSVDCSKLTTPRKTLDYGGKPGFFKLIGFLAEVPRNIGFKVYHDPENDNWSHCTVEGENSKDTAIDIASKSRVIEID